MSILLVGHSKGGVGKSTIATNLAVALATRRRDVLLVDGDRQATATHWAQERAEAAGHPKLPHVQVSGDVRPTLTDLARRYDDLVLDVSGRDSTELRTAMMLADVMLVPTRPSQADLWELDDLAKLVEHVLVVNEKLAPWAVINMAPHNTREGEEAREMFEEYPTFKLAATVLHDRKVYREAMLGGAGVIELQNEKATAEVTGLAFELFGRGGATRGVQKEA